jgi:hypothetical protein
MKEFLEKLEIGEGKVKLSQEEIKSILIENGKIVTNETKKVEDKYTSQIDTYKTTITDLNNQLKDIPDSKELETLKKQVADFEKKEAQRIADEKAKQEDEVLTTNILNSFGDKKFASEYAKNGLIADIKSELNKPENKGRGITDIMESLTKDKSGIFENPNKPADMPGMGDGATSTPDNLDEMSYEQYKEWRKNN